MGKLLTKALGNLLTEQVGKVLDIYRHQRTRDIEEIKWMQKYVRGIDWTPWERKEEKKEEKAEEKK